MVAERALRPARTQRGDPVDDDWIYWLKSHCDPKWLPGQWDPSTWVFVADPKDPKNTVDVCVARGCNAIVTHSRLCGLCSRELRASGKPRDEFLRTYYADRKKQHPLGGGLEQCIAIKLRIRCPRKEVHNGLCRMHYNGWRRARGQDESLTRAQWVNTGGFTIPADALDECKVPGCARDAYYCDKTLCALHHGRYQKSGSSESPKAWATTETPYVSVAEFGLGHLDVQLRWEVLFGLQQRIARGGRINPSTVRTAVDEMRRHPSFATMPEDEALRIASGYSSVTATGAFLAEMARVLRRAHDDMEGIRPDERLIWDLVEVGAMADPTIRGGNRRRRGVDFTKITQPWLRSAAMGCCRDLARSGEIQEVVKATVVASDALEQRGDRGLDIGEIDYRAADTVAEAFRTLKRKDGELHASTYRRMLYMRFFRMIGDARRKGLLDELPSSFSRDRSHSIPENAPASDDDYGKSLPEVVIAQLDAHLDTIGLSNSYPGLSEKQVQLMFATVYLLLRDTGRRPKEIASLKLTCLGSDINGPILTYDNHKAGRLNRRLPITQSTVDILKRWLKTRRRMQDVSPISSEYVFPGHTQYVPYLTTTRIGEVFRRWLATMERIEGPGTGRDGLPVPFERVKITARALRHTYAQRHADNGTPIDVLRELMDHTSIQTTGLYYVVTTDRKREAVKTVGQYSIDRKGNPRPIADGTRYLLRAVAVPFGNCVEPSNVKSGGTACPIRFQCAGCGFYRPDPSYIPAIEEHLNKLRGDREVALAIDVAPYVLDNLNAQIASFEEVLSKMHKTLAVLDADERSRINEASVVLRKMRASNSIPLEIVSRPQDPGSNDG